MKRPHTALLYIAMLAGTVGLFFFIRHFGPASATERTPIGAATPSGAGDGALAHVLLALVVIVAAARLLGAALRSIGQPPVVGEMIAGIVLGPSLLGRVAPGVFAHLFPPTDFPLLSVMSQVGVILFMFLVGLELDTTLLRQRTQSSVAISHASIVTPFLMGATLALWLYPSLSSPEVSFTQFALFMGVAMSVTAFPVLARILTDRGMQKSRLGTLALACAAADDVTAWCLLALLVGVVRARPETALQTVVLTAAFILIVLFVVRPAANRFARRHDSIGQLTPTTVVVVCAVLLLGALATERIGIHALFGSFLMGVVLPRDSVLARDLKKMFEAPVVAILLPVFFVLTGLRTQIGLMNSGIDWLFCLAIVAVASLGKFGGTFVAARLTGSNSREAASLGVLMNTRGLMELIVLTVGLDLGVLSARLFAMLVLMAIATTFATAPLLRALGGNAPTQA